MQIKIPQHWRTVSLRLHSFFVSLHHLLSSPLEPVLHATPTRLVWLGIYALLANVFFHVLWLFIFPQPYESRVIRGVMIILSIFIIYLGLNPRHINPFNLRLVGLIFWVQLPVVTFFMYLANGGNYVWISTLTAMILVYFVLVDWRMATLGSLAGFCFAFGTYLLTDPYASFPDGEKWKVDLFVVGFVWGAGIIIGMSAASRQKLQLSHMMTTIGIVAHELRTPLSAIGLIADATDRFTHHSTDEELKIKLKDLADRTRLLTSQMNALIDMQIANASIENLRVRRDQVLASALIKDVMSRYPFKSTKEKNCWEISIRQDFTFVATKSLFDQVFFNLTKNALNALYKAQSNLNPGSIRIEIMVDGQYGILAVHDKGIGIEPKLHNTIFEPFFSTNENTGHGLGLTFCKRVVDGVDGKLTVQSTGLGGASFIVSLPRLNATI